MCEIVGILGKQAVATDLVDALRRLEYRGYNSAGVATVEEGHLDRRRAEGKLKNLEQRLHNSPLQGRTGLGHTRWATHGKPVEHNAHPHMNDRVAVVHNGIIENFQELKEELAAKGHRFETETDTETVLHLVSDYLAQGLPPVDAARSALRRLRGAFALGLIFAGDDDLMIGARQGPPLAIGHGSGEMYLGSDAIALAPFTDTITYLEDGDWAVLSRANVQVYNLDGQPVRRAAVKSTASALLVDKGNFRHFMAKEIHEQPEVIGHTLANYVDFGRGTVTLPDLGIDPARIDRVAIAACGTAYFAGLIGKYWLERYARVPVEIDVASEFRYREPPLAPGGLAVFVSQSGETADTLATLRYCKSQGQRIAAVVNVRTSTIAREADTVLPTLAGPEIGVASTKAFTSQLAVLACLAIGLGRARGAIGAAQEAELVRALGEVPRHIATVLRSEARYEALAHRLAKAQDVLYLGRGSELSDCARRRPEAEGDLLHPRRGLRRRRAQARADRPHRREGAGDRGGARGRPVREDRLQPAGGGGARRPDRAAVGRGPGAGRMPCGRAPCGPRRPSLHQSDPLRHSRAAHRLSHRGLHGHRRGPAPQPRQVGDGGIGGERRVIAQAPPW